MCPVCRAKSHRKHVATETGGQIWEDIQTEWLNNQSDGNDNHDRNPNIDIKNIAINSLLINRWNE